MKKTNNNRQEFLLTFFDEREEYQEKEVNGFMLVRYVDGKTGLCHVMIFTKESFKNYKGANKSLF